MTEKLKIETLTKHVKPHEGLILLYVNEALYSKFSDSPSQIIDFTLKTMRKYLQDDPMADFAIFEQNLMITWERIGTIGLTQNLRLVLGAYGQKLRKISFSPSDEQETLLLKVDMTPGEMKKIHPLWLYHSIAKKMKKSTYEWRPDKANIESVWERIVHSMERIKEYPIRSAQKFTPHRKRKSYRIISRKDSGDIIVTLENLRKYPQKDLQKLIIKDVIKEVEEMASDSRNTGVYKIFVKHIKTQLKSAFYGPQCLEVGLPYSFIGAIRVNFDYISERVHPALPSALLKLCQAGSPLESLISSPICESKEDLEVCLQQLEKMGLIVFDREKRVFNVPNRIRILGFVENNVNKNLICETLTLAKDSLSLKEKLRTYNTMMIGISKNDIPKYIEMTESLKRQTLELLNTDSQLENHDKNLFHLNLQVFPLTRTSPKYNHSLYVKNENYRNSRWCKLLVREMAGLPGSHHDPIWFAQHMEPAIPLEDIKASLSMLKKGGFLKVDPVSGSLIQTSKDIITESPRYTQGSQFHTDVLDLAIYSIEWEPTTPYEFVSQSYYCSHGVQKEISDIYYKYMVDVFNLASKSVRPNLIYQISFQTFPIIFESSDIHPTKQNNEKDIA